MAALPPPLCYLPPVGQRVMATIYVYLALGASFILIWFVQVIFMALAYPFTRREQRQDGCGHIFRYLSYVMIDLLNPFWTVHVLNKFPQGLNWEANRPDRKIILMMNHLSGADPFLAIRAFLPRDGSWIAKGELFSVPFGGWDMGNSDDLPVFYLDKGSKSFELRPGTVGPMMARARAKLRRGRMLCVFPEGTRSSQPERKNYFEPFRLGFFDLALEEGALIVPLAISGTNRCWPAHQILMNVEDCYFSYGDVVDSRDFHSSQDLLQHVRQVLMTLRESHPDRVSMPNDAE